MESRRLAVGDAARYSLFSVLLLAHCGRPAPGPLTPEAILSLRALDGDIQLSPNGKFVAAVIAEPADPTAATAGGETNIWIIPTAPGAAPRRLAGSSGADNTPRWSPDGRSLAFLSSRAEVGGKQGSEQLYVEPTDSGQARRLTTSRGGITAFAWAPDNRAIAFVAREAAGDDTVAPRPNEQPARVYAVGVSDGKVRAVTHGASDVAELAWSPTADRLAILVVRGPPGGSSGAWDLQVIDASSGALVRVLSDNAAPIDGALRWSRDARWISFLQNSPSQLASWLAVVPAAGGPIRGVLQDDTGTVWRAEWMDAPDRLLAEEVRGTAVALRAVDLRTHTIEDWTSFTVSQGSFGLSTDGRIAAYVSDSPRSPADVWLVAPGTSPRRLTALNPHVSSWRLGAVRSIDWHSARDGSVVHGVIVTPPDFRPGHPYPTVVETHPGDLPWWPGWLANWWAWGQLLATHGYVVFLPNYRGVTGQGWRAHEHLGEWGGLAYEDLMDGIDTLVRRGIADSARLGIGGWSNGGFMAEWAITHTTRFRAAVAKSAHADFAALYATSPSSRPDLLLDFGGPPSDHRAVYDAHSPITYVRSCATPTLLVYGEHDVVSPGQGEEFDTALRAQRVPSQLVIYPREEHGLGEYAHRVDFQRRVLAWFDRYLK